ncbi:MAG: UDP-N-acetylmuramate dehydrogenase [Bacteroides sp.]|nr:UDP-N-acetylmuramate dehydrogenase [Bacteroides sp.]
MITIQENLSLAPLHTMGLDVRCRRYIKFNNAADLSRVRTMLSPDEPLLIMGAGSNLLFTKDFDGTILYPDIRYIKFSGCDVTAGAGVTMDHLIKEACHRGLWGMENLSGIPGTVGASVVQNVGAYGVEAGDLVKTVYLYDLATGFHERMEADDCKFGYRDSVFKHLTGKVILGVTYRLSPYANPRLDYGNLRQMVSDIPMLRPIDVRRTVMEVRDSKLPRPEITGSAGSFFKNPVISREDFEALKTRLGNDTIPHFDQPDGIKIPAAWLIDKAGCKGMTSGGASVWQSQPLVIVNADGNATPSDILDLEKAVVKAVEEFSGITLIPEVQHI